MGQNPKKPLDGTQEWVTVWAVRNRWTGQLVRRKDGKPFKFPVRKRAKSAGGRRKN